MAKTETSDTCIHSGQNQSQQAGTENAQSCGKNTAVSNGSLHCDNSNLSGESHDVSPELTPGDMDGSDSDQLRYGWRRLQPSFLGCLNTAVCYSVFMMFANIFQSGTVNGLVGAVQSTLETRYGLSSSQSSWVYASYEIATIPVSLFIVFIGTRGIHRPRWTAAFLMVSALGCVIFTIPQFATPVYVPEGQGGEEQTCGSNLTGCEGDDSAGSLQGYVAVFVLGMVCLAFGATGLANFAVTFLDDCTPRDKLSLYTCK